MPTALFGCFPLEYEKKPDNDILQSFSSIGLSVIPLSMNKNLIMAFTKLFLDWRAKEVDLRDPKV